MLFDRDKLHTLREQNPFLPSTELAYRMVLDGLLDGQLEPGAHLNQNDLAQQLDMSRSPVRDALLRLSEEGFVSRTPRGFQAPLLDGQDFADFMEYRCELESFSARLATHWATRDQLAAMENNLAEYQDAIEREDRSAATRLDSAFHALVGEASHNRYLQAAYDQLLRQSRFYLIRLVPHQNVVRNLQRHRAIYKAIAAHDEEGAAAAIRAHMTDAMRTALRVQKDQAP
ncbi:GntR family transcriptional regulator [Pseudoflavonifractor phocaeensis]|uniref:GntR family transcriptional regulator n=1 Tax=Pseudoflavonifractor phocaeensis TaxID=1870988 RepID=UPI001F19C6C9|nr:GntR family transcriptional regulator [Pseudoflavonifractor phocaeensis]MCF2595088.1 GntR family transcriptional regulator [Pseudoflavonifractor phocaeensis]MDY3905859.1 GntR family transcriptional regulator [Lawsonibacter sp.]